MYLASIPILQVKRTNALMGKIIQNSDGSKFKEEENRKLTKMVSTIIGIFLLCNSPKIPFFIFANHQPSHGSVWQAITQITGQEISEGNCGTYLQFSQWKKKSKFLPLHQKVG